MTIKVNRQQLTFLGFYILTVIGCFVLPSILNLALCLMFIVYLTVLGSNAVRKKNEKLVSELLVFPIFLSCVQNLYLALAADKLQSFELQIILTLNIIIAFMLPTFKLLIARNIKQYSDLVLAIIAIAIIAFVSLLISNVPITSFVSCLRNILAPFIYLYYGLTFGEDANYKAFKKYILVLITFVIIFGFLEYFTGYKIWDFLEIAKLWNLKGIVTNKYPSNWYSSEVIFGRAYVRRMVSAFADPVNLGTFLFAAFMICWYYKKYLLMCLTFVCCILTISKGALLGFLIFGVVFMWFKDRTKLTTIVAVSFGLVVGISLMRYGANSSAGLHLTMFMRALKVPFSYPFGMGVGSTGVLANVTGGNSDLAIMETGIGVVIAQLGIVGIVAYVYLFFKSCSIPKKFSNRDKLFLYTLIFSIFANAMFNEVALSPNSCGIYFLILGIWGGIQSRQEKDGVI